MLYVHPQYLSDLAPHCVHENKSYNLRKANALQTIYAYTSLYYISFLPSLIREWNKYSLPNHIRQADSLAIFKRHLNSYISPKPL